MAKPASTNPATATELGKQIDKAKGNQQTVVEAKIDQLKQKAPAYNKILVSFNSHIYTKPTTQSVYDVPSIYKVVDKKNVLVKSSDLQKANIDEKNITLNYNKFILSIGSEFDLKLSVSDNNVKDFRKFVEKLFDIYYENNMETTFSSEKLEQNFTFANLFASGNLSKSQLLDCSVAALSLDTGTSSIRFPIGFVINKYNGKKDYQSTIDIPLQKFFISLSDINVANTVPLTSGIFYDNQIAVDGTYSYFVQTVDLVINYEKDVPKSVDFITEYKEQDFSSYDASIPPLTPNVDIRNYSNTNNKLLILLNVNDGTDAYQARSINLFTQKQKELFAKVYKDKGINQPNDKYIYSASQSQEKYFFIYRVDSKPTSYDQIILEKNIIKKLDIQKFETSFDDKISPNKKYYYCFVVQDSSGILSDASLVYEAEMIDQGGTVYLKQNAFIPEPKINFVSTKDFQDRTRIFPVDAQINIPDKLQQYVELYFDGSDTKYNLDYLNTFDFLSNKLGIKSKTIKQEENVDLKKTALTLEESVDLKKTALTLEQKNKEGETKAVIQLQPLDPSLLGFALELQSNEAGQEINTIAETLKNKIFKFVTIEQAQANFEKFLQDNFTFVSKVIKETKDVAIGDVILSTESKNITWSNIPSAKLDNKISDANKEIIYLSEQISQLFSYIVKNPNEPLTIQKQNSLDNFVAKFFEIASTLLFVSILDIKIINNKKLSEILLPAETVFSNNNNVVYKVRIESQNSKKKFDLNITYNLQISEKIQLLENSGITKQFEVLKSEPY